MRKIVLIIAAIAALVSAGIAVAHESDSKSVKSVSATFTATGASVVKTATCTGTDGTYATTKATYTGMAISTEPSLNGPVTVKTESVVNTTTDVGTVSGRLRIEGAGGKLTEAEFGAVYSKANLAGLAAGHSGDHVQLLGNLSAGFTAAGGFTNGKLGGATTGGDAVLVTPGGCQPAATPKADRIDVHGAVSAVSTSSITAAGVTCAIPTELQSDVAKLALASGSQVELTCTVAGGTNTLVKVAPRGKESEKGSKEHSHKEQSHKR
jgi:hypothetical protein